MRKLLTIAALLITSLSYGQGTWTKAVTNTIVNRSKADSVQIVPRDTSATNNALYNGVPVGDSGRIAFYKGQFWGHKGVLGWLPLGQSTPIDSNTWIRNGPTGAQSASFYISGIAATLASYRVNLPPLNPGDLDVYHPTFQVDFSDGATSDPMGINIQPSYDLSGQVGIDFYIRQGGAYTKGVRFLGSDIYANYGFFGGTVQGANATASNEFVTRLQVTDTLNARFSSIPTANLNAVTTVGNISGNRINITGQNGSGKTGLSLSNSGTTATVESWNASGPAAGTLLFNPSGGDVGVGMTPTARLSVNGIINAANRIESTDGTVSAVMSFGSGTGIWGTFTNHPMLFYTNLTERMRLSAAGRLLINTTTDDGASALQINGPFKALGTTNAFGAYKSTNGDWSAGTDDGGNGTNGNQFWVYNNTDSKYRFTIQKGTGNVGIGTTTPLFPLVVSDGAGMNLEMALADVTHGNFIQSYNRTSSSSQPLSFFASRFNLAGGNVGLGTTSPEEPLDVRGDAVVSGGPTLSQGRLRLSHSTAAGDLYGESYSGGWVAGTINLNGTDVNVNSSLNVSDFISAAGLYLSTIRTITTTQTLNGTDNTVLCNNTGGAITVTLPSASTYQYKIIIIKKIGAGGVGVNVVNIVGSSFTNNFMQLQGSCIIFQSDGTTWHVIGGTPGNAGF